MIVLLRGTSGSGKSYIAFRVMETLGEPTNTLRMVDTSLKYPTEKLAGYWWAMARVSLLGRYDVACGGCDVISWPGAPDHLERLALRQADHGHVLLEGLLVGSWGGDRLRRLGPLTIIHLTTSLDDCLVAVNARRAARGEKLGKDLGPVNPKNTTKKHRGLLSSSIKQAKEGLRVEWLNRNAALEQTFNLLGIAG